MYIGIILRKNKNRYTLNSEIVNVIKNYGFEPIGITNNLKKNKQIISLCKGFILQGGDDFDNNDLEIVKYLYEKNIPTLGICLGMQMMSSILNGKLYKVKKHKKKKKYVHNITILKNTKLYEIIKKENIKVNSRHKEAIKNIDACAFSKNVIEAIEDKNKKFFIGVQWHPESIIDENSKALFNYFFNIVKTY